MSTPELSKTAKVILKFFRWFCNHQFAEDIEGDLMERFYRHSNTMSNRKANFHFVLSVISLIKPTLFQKRSALKAPWILLENQVKASLRNIKREGAFSLLNVLSLTIGISAFIYIALYTHEELSFDKFHNKASRIYRINQTFIWGGTDKLFASTGPGVQGAILAEVPEFEAMCRIHDMNNTLVTYQFANTKKVFEEHDLRGADSNFFQIFNFPLKHGNPNDALVKPNSLVITSSTAIKYFGTDDVIGKQLLIGEGDDQKSYQVTGVAEDIPHNSHITFNILISTSSLDRLKRWGDSWTYTTFVTFGLLRQDADPEVVAEKVSKVPGKYLEAFFKRYRNITYQEFLASGEEWELYMQPLLDIHLNSTDVLSRLNSTGAIRTIYILNTIGILILVLSVINFINLTTARSFRRSKETSVRKVLGSNRWILGWQFIFESIFFCSLAVFLGFVLVIAFLPAINDVSGKEIPWSIFAKSTIWFSAVAGTLLIGVLAGIYPAIHLSSFRPGAILKGMKGKNVSSGLVRNWLVTLQFTVSIGLIASAIIIENQVTFWRTMDLGFNRENKLILAHVERLGEQQMAFQHTISQYSQIESITHSSDALPYIGASDSDFFLKSRPEENVELGYCLVDENFLDVYGIEMIAGRNFDINVDEKNNVIVSRSLAKTFGFVNPEEILNERIIYFEYDRKIIGVFEDFTSELFWEQRPLALFYKGEFEGSGDTRYLTITLKEGQESNFQLLLSGLEKEWSNFNPDAPFQYSFLDQEYNLIFNPTIKFGHLIRAYSILAVIIAILGLIGLVTYMIERRNKEIGVRKVLGASVSNLFLLLSKEFTKLLIVGSIIATPIAWFFMSSWIADFEHQISITGISFLQAGIIMSFIAFCTLLIPIVKAIRNNPTKYLSEE